MSKKRPSFLGILILPLATLLCLGGLVAVNQLLRLNDQAEARFGPPVAGLAPFTRLRYAALLVAQADDLTNPPDPAGSEVPFEVLLGESAASVVGRLYQAGLIANPGAFRTYLQYSGRDTSLQAGMYRLSPAMSGLEIAAVLQDATPTEVPFRVLSGWRLEEIAAALPTSGLAVSPEEFLTTARARPWNVSFTSDLPPGASLEGFLFPETYTLVRDISAQELVLELLQAFDRRVDAELRAGFSRQGLSLYEAVTLASIIEREAIEPEESPLIASVFYNRLALGMKLDADPTVQYAVGFNEAQQTWWTNPLRLDDLAFDSPYNTYKYPGLPPSPIANPDLPALRAVAFPASTPYYYFRAACDGSNRHVFAETFEEHQANACP